jgi:hypothetical protein
VCDVTWFHVLVVAKETLSKKSREELSLEETLFGSTGAVKLVHGPTIEDRNTESDISVADENDIDNDEDEINVTHFVFTFFFL